MRTDHVVALVGRIREKANDLIVSELEKRGHRDLAPSHGAILARLYELGPLPMGVLATSIHRKKNTVTTLVRKLEAAGYVRREPSPEDSRVTLIALTGRGEDFRGDFEAVSEILLKTVWGDLAQAEREMLVAGLERVSANLG